MFCSKRILRQLLPSRQHALQQKDRYITLSATSVSAASWLLMEVETLVCIAYLAVFHQLSRGHVVVVNSLDSKTYPSWVQALCEPVNILKRGNDELNKNMEDF